MKLRLLCLLGVLLLIVSSCASAATDEESVSPATEPTTEPTAEPVEFVDDDAVIAAANQFLEIRSPQAARDFLAAVDGNSGERWVPWVVDLLRAGVSNRVDIAAGEQLERLTGVPSENRINDLTAYGSWTQNNGLDGGEGYVDFKAGLYERFDPRFGDLLRSVADPAEVAAIQWGGVPIGGIPELNDPERVTVAEADHMFDDEIILGVEFGGQAVAYPLRVLARHELANDTVGGLPIALVYCTLCRSALVFERDLGDQTVTFLTSGLLVDSNKIMYDPETGTLWSHLRGIGIGGPLTGTELALGSVNHLRWSDWVAEHPDTEVITLPPPIFFDDPERGAISYDYTPGEAYRSYYDDPDLWFPSLDAPDTFDLKTEVVGFRHNDDAVAFSVEAFNVIDTETEIEVGGDTFTVEPTGVGVRIFDAAGERVNHEQSFWFAWFTNNPMTRSLEF